MARFTERRWQSQPGLAPGVSEQQPRAYAAYTPDYLRGRQVRLSAELAAEVSEVDQLVREFNDSAPTSPHLESLARFLLRSEAVASSRIEGVVASARAIAHLELMLATKAGDEPRAGIGDSAREVVNNVLALRKAVTALTSTPCVTVDDINGLQAALMVETEQHDLAGKLREVQNWVGGNAYGPHGAEYVPPAPELVGPLMEDLAAFISEDQPLPLVQAALVHAQFETIHPYTDGNGRTGRALIHTVLARQGLAVGHVLPISMSLLAHAREYIAGLEAYRYNGSADSAAAMDGTEAWIRVFLAATRDAVAEARRFTDELGQMRDLWQARLANYRESCGLRPHPRKGAAVVRLMEQLPGVPVLTARAAGSLLKTSFVSASKALEELAGAGIVQVKDAERGTRAFLASDVLDLINGAERRLTYTKWSFPDLEVESADRP
ncbi:Fic family protein [Streptomyces sp. A012304]|uniref:Fic family protein n=1 Tax=Streptomyces sp. A012304 TaxID=375446 RepID=UPI00222FEFFC|nr:Fic family protein [Streptomyces sp. A012304]GKQ33539.1 Fic family protein [Streptomyces sp. A012304]